jgi:hypothetical protein
MSTEALDETGVVLLAGRKVPVRQDGCRNAGLASPIEPGSALDVRHRDSHAGVEPSLANRVQYRLEIRAAAGKENAESPQRLPS